MSLLIFIAIAFGMFLLMAVMMLAVVGMQVGLLKYWIDWWNEPKSSKSNKT